MSANELQPSPDEVLQAEEPEGTESAVKVRVENPVRTQALPRKAGATKTVSAPALQTAPVPGAGAVQLLRADARRAKATLTSPDPFLVALDKASAQEVSQMAFWPAGVPLTIEAVCDIYVASVTGPSTVAVSAVIELWATGEGSD